MAMPEVPETIFMDGLNELLKIDQAWIKKKYIVHSHLFMIATGEGVTNPSDNHKFMIILSPAKSYYSEK
jgi:branched-chain amino acid aminotransferase